MAAAAPDERSSVTPGVKGPRSFTRTARDFLTALMALERVKSWKAFDLAQNFHAWPRYRFNKAQQGKGHREQNGVDGCPSENSIRWRFSHTTFTQCLDPMIHQARRAKLRPISSMRVIVDPNESSRMQFLALVQPRATALTSANSQVFRQGSRKSPRQLCAGLVRCQ